MAPAKSVVITGASTGIGAACALHLDQLGWRVFAGVRKQADAEAIRAQGSPRLTPISLDVTDTVSISTAASAVAGAVGAAGQRKPREDAAVPGTQDDKGLRRLRVRIGRRRRSRRRRLTWRGREYDARSARF